MNDLNLGQVVRIIPNTQAKYDDPSRTGVWCRNFRPGEQPHGEDLGRNALYGLRVAAGEETAPAPEWEAAGRLCKNPARGTLGCGAGFSYQPHCLRDNEVCASCVVYTSDRMR